MPKASVVIPAHNEGRVLGRLLKGLGGADLEIVVVANGCDDDTAEVAAAFGARVVETPVPSKREALRLGDEHATAFPRVYLDADVEIGAADVLALCEALDRVLAAAPERDLVMEGRPWPVRAYYAIWSRLPAVREGLFGRGVIAVGEEGGRRVMALPPVMGDDLAASLAFAPGERAVVRGARVRVHPPRTVADLLRRRVRAVTAVAEIGGGDARTGVGDLVRIALREPWLAPHLAVFLGVTLVARARARRVVRAGDFTTWLRDESSRT
ncbi:glycosyltransferase [Thermoactinospora rubra]|uniref:glycosyltransferase n=1 Tax=Thermoactinospora rubra TaxID=1088767 RepID=UPI000A118283|nr:glycosyltransferase [Thermoactinospora rubra]